VSLREERDTFELAGKLVPLLFHAAPVPLFVMYLEGDLGAGKTTFVRAVLRALGVSGTIRSPTFTLLETYEIGEQLAAHLDLYRLTAPEVETLGVRDLLAEGTVLFVEWPERGGKALPPPDIRLRLELKGEGRVANISAHTERGRQVVQQWLR
jgi:tRNA threonylcarbamoyladenosine biosynthesis protein TsaE